MTTRPWNYPRSRAAQTLLRFTPEDKAALRDLAALEDLPMNELVSKLVREELARRETPE